MTQKHILQLHQLETFCSWHLEGDVCHLQILNHLIVQNFVSGEGVQTNQMHVKSLFNLLHRGQREQAKHRGKANDLLYHPAGRFII